MFIYTEILNIPKITNSQYDSGNINKNEEILKQSFGPPTKLQNRHLRINPRPNQYLNTALYCSNYKNVRSLVKQNER